MVRRFFLVVELKEERNSRLLWVVSNSKKTTLAKLTKRTEFLHVSKNGDRVYSGDYLIVNFVSNGLGNMRCGWTIPKYVGSAVTRNKMRRWCREFFREKLMSGWNPSLDLNIVMKRKEKNFFKGVDFNSFKGHLEKACRKIEKRSLWESFSSF